MDTTTIQITTEQRDELDKLKDHENEPYKSVLQGLITNRKANGGGTGDTPESDAVDVDVDNLATRIVDEIGAGVGGPQVDDSEIAREVAAQLDYVDLAEKTARKVTEEL